MRTSTSNKAPHKIKELATLLPSPINDKTMFSKSLNSFVIWPLIVVYGSDFGFVCASCGSM